jgi:hypothetical protein
MYHLVSVIRYCWMASPRDCDVCPSPRLWKVDFVQLALDRWLQSKTDRIPQAHLEPDQMLLYHMAHISLQTDIECLHRLTQAAIQAALSSQAIETLKSGIQPWTSQRQYEIAIWHAKVVLRIAREGTTLPRRHTTTSLRGDRPQFVEPPHLPLCVYFATLAVWYGNLKFGGQSADSVNISVEAGSQLLFELRVPMASFLASALCELLPAGKDNGQGSGRDDDGAVHVESVPRAADSARTG